MPKKSQPYILFTGDALVVFVVSLVGFLSHNESPLELVNRFLASWIPFTAAWLLAGYGLGLYQTSRFSIDGTFLASLLAAPLGGVMRGLWLGTAVQTTFVLVMAAALGLGMIVWRWAWARAGYRSGD